MRPPRASTRPLHLWLTSLLVLALLWAQALGFAHRALHAPMPVLALHAPGAMQALPSAQPGPGLDVQTRAQAHGTHHAVAGAGVWGHLEHAPLSPADCRLYDQLAHDQGPLAQGFALVVPCRAHAQPVGLDTARSAPAPQHFQARAPPHRG